MTARLSGFVVITALAAACASPARAGQTQRPDALSSCAPCHGLDGIGHDAEVPNLAGQNQAYLYNQLRAFHEGRRKHKEMDYMSRKMTDEEMRALAAYFAGLPPR